MRCLMPFGTSCDAEQRAQAEVGGESRVPARPGLISPPHDRGRGAICAVFGRSAPRRHRIGRVGIGGSDSVA